MNLWDTYPLTIFDTEKVGGHSSIYPLMKVANYLYLTKEKGFLRSQENCVNIINDSKMSPYHISEYDIRIPFPLPHGSVENKLITEYFKEKFNCSVKVCVNVSDRSSIIFFDNSVFSIRAGIHLACFLPLIAPWLFEEGYKPSENFTNLIELVQKEKYNDVLCLITDLEEKKASSDKAIKLFEKTFISSDEENLQNILNETTGYLDEIRDYEEKIVNLYRRIRENEIKCAGIRALKDTSTEDEFENYIGCLDVEFFLDNNRSYTRVFGYIDNYDIEDARICLKNSGASIYERLDYATWRPVLEKIFLARKYRLAVYSETKILKHIPKSSRNNNNYERNGVAYIANPHIQYFGCYGGNSTDISNSAVRKDPYGIIEGLQAANGNINFGDSVVMSELSEHLKTLADKDIKCLVARDGTPRTFKEVMNEIAAENPTV